MLLIVSQKLQHQRNENYLIQSCEKCGEKFELTEGTVLYDGKWYHHSCWHYERKLIDG